MPAVPAAPTTVDVAAFDPYAAAIPLRWLRKVRNGVLLLLAPVVAGLLAASAAVGGMLGDGGDFQPLDDFWRAVGAQRPHGRRMPAVPARAGHPGVVVRRRHGGRGHDHAPAVAPVH